MPLSFEEARAKASIERGLEALNNNYLNERKIENLAQIIDRKMIKEQFPFSISFESYMEEFVIAYKYIYDNNKFQINKYTDYAAYFKPYRELKNEKFVDDLRALYKEKAVGFRLEWRELFVPSFWETFFTRKTRIEAAVTLHVDDLTEPNEAVNV